MQRISKEATNFNFQVLRGYEHKILNQSQRAFEILSSIASIEQESQLVTIQTVAPELLPPFYVQ